MELDKEYIQGHNSFKVTLEETCGFIVYAVYINRTKIATFNNDAYAFLRVQQMISTQKKKYKEPEHTLNYKEIKRV